MTRSRALGDAEWRLCEPDHPDQAKKQQGNAPEDFAGGQHGALGMNHVLDVGVGGIARNTDLIELIEVLPRFHAGGCKVFGHANSMRLGAMVPERDYDGGTHAARQRPEEAG